MRKTWPRFEADEIRAALRVLKSGKVNQWTGKEVSSFEEEFRAFVGATFAVAFANGSLALEAAYACAAIPGKRDILVPARSFVATAMAAKRAGHEVVFVDVGLDGNASHANYYRKMGPEDAAFGIVHLGGKPVDVKPILGLKRPVVEDCAQALGATIGGKHVGTFGAAGVFSFCQDKTMTTGGEGGMVVTNDYGVYRSVWAWKDHGKCFEDARLEGNGTYRYLHKEIGTNARMTEMQAAIGRVQLRKVRKWVRQRRLVAERLRDRLQEIPGLTAPAIAQGESCYRYYATVDPDAFLVRRGRDTVIADLKASGIRVGTGVCPEIYREHAFQWRDEQHCGTARRLATRTLCFTIDHLMTERDAARIAKRVKAVMKEAVGVQVQSGGHSG